MKDDRDHLLRQRLEEAWQVPQMSPRGRDRFLGRLEKAERSARRRTMGIRLAIFTSVAAALMGFALLIVRPAKTSVPEPTPMELALAELKGYYKAKMWTEAEYIDRLSARLDEQTHRDIMAEMDRLQHGTDSLVEQLQREPMQDDMKIYYITNLYRVHLRSMQQLHSLLDDRLARK